jgi:hypothetical protein
MRSDDEVTKPDVDRMSKKMTTKEKILKGTDALNSKDFKDTLSKLIPNSLQLAVSEQ